MSVLWRNPNRSLRISAFLIGLLALPFAFSPVLAQDADEADENDEVLEEIVTVGSQIKGAHIAEALAVSVIKASEIEGLGVDSGDELIEFMAEQGQNYFAESESISGGVNSARGDVGAFNLRNLGTGNTLVLLNGRRMVNMANYQTELTGGSFIPVNSVNSQSLPVSGLERVEILRDGASAIYGADAVAGVVNYVLKTDFEGLSLSAKYTSFEGLPRNDHNLTLEWGKNFNDDHTNISVFANYYHRDPVNGQDDPRWANDDFRPRVSSDSPWFGDNAFNNNSANSAYGQFDIQRSGNFGLAALGITDSAGELQVYPDGNAECAWYFTDNTTTCAGPDGPPIYRYNNNIRDVSSDLDRLNMFVFLNHDFGNGLESFTEFSVYTSDTKTIRQGSFRNTGDAFIVAADNYYNPFGPIGSVNRLPESLIGTGVPAEGLALLIDNYRVETPRIVNNDGTDLRFLQGLRGKMGDWEWESAAIWSRSKKQDVTDNRVSATLFQEALNDTTPAAFNPFMGPANNNIERALISVRRDSQAELKSIDFKISQNELFGLPAGPVGAVTGIEYRQESFVDDRDPRLDGTINWVTNQGVTFPEVSDVMNSSPSADSSGSRNTLSAFGELQVPVLDNLDMQLALRYEDFSDVGDTTVGKIALGWRPIEQVLFRGSWSEAYRVPNLVTVNEGDVVRTNTVSDYLMLYVDPTQALPELDGSYLMQRAAGGSDQLVPEQSTNTSFGVVWDVMKHLTLTLDYWSIEKDDTIGLFGEANHTALDLLMRLEAGTSNCSSNVGNPAVLRNDPADLPQEALDMFAAAGLCPAGSVIRVEDVYKNLDKRTVTGHDIGVYFTYDTGIGSFDFTYNGSFLDKFAQTPGPAAQEIISAKDAGILPESVVLSGFGDLIRQDANPESKQSFRMGWRRNDWGATFSGTRISDVIQTSLTLDDGSEWVLAPMMTYNASIDYRFNAFGDTDARVRLGAVNMFNKRAPLADDFFGYNGDVHRDLPRSFYLSLKLDF